MFAILASIMMLASCANDDFSPINERDGEVSVTMTTSLPQNLQSYALNSAEGGLVNIENEKGNYAVRYIMEVYPKNSTEMVKRMITYIPITENGNYRTTSFSTRLIAAEYNFVFWADIVKKVTAVDAGVGADLENVISTLTTEGVYGNRYLISKYADEGNYLEDSEAILAYNTGTKDHYETTSLQNVTIGNAADSHFQSEFAEANDAYRNVTSIDLRSDSPIGTIKLTRPFAKLRVISTDKAEIDAQHIDIDNILVSPTFTADMPSTINVLTGKTTGKVAQFDVLQSKLAKYDNEASGEYTIGVWYCFAPTNTSTDVDLNIGVKGSTQYTGINVSVANVPLVENKLTTIKGKLFSKSAAIEIIINDELEEGDELEFGKEVSSPETLMDSFTGKSEQIKYAALVTKEDGLKIDFSNISRSTPVYEAGNDAVLTLDIPYIEKGAVISILGGDNVPSAIVLNTKNECSICVNADKTKIVLGGAQYRYLVYNCDLDYNSETEPSVDAFLVVDNDVTNIFYPLNEDFHRIYLTSDYKIKENCRYHTNCSLQSTINTWLESNTGKNVFDFVEANK